MRVKTMAIVGSLVLVSGYAGLQVATDNLAPRSSSQEMAKPRKYRLPDDPGQRGVVVLQLCWYPAESAQVSVGWSLGALGTSVDNVGVPLNCQTPWQRKAVLGRGERAALGWTLAKGPVSKFKYRVTVNNRPRIDGTETAGTRMYACIVGTPPCELP